MSNHPRHRAHGPAWRSNGQRRRRAHTKAKGERTSRGDQLRERVPRFLEPVARRIESRARRG